MSRMLVWLIFAAAFPFVGSACTCGFPPPEAEKVDASKVADKDLLFRGTIVAIDGAATFVRKIRMKVDEKFDRNAQVKVGKEITFSLLAHPCSGLAKAEKGQRWEVRGSAVSGKVVKKDYERFARSLGAPLPSPFDEEGMYYSALVCGGTHLRERQ